jgi:hypothetical protein
MFVRSYTYTIKRADFNRWKKIIAAANAMYAAYGVIRFENFVRPTSKRLEIVEMAYYKTVQDAVRIGNKADKDERVLGVYKKFMKMVDRKKLVINEYETIKL